MQKPFAVPVILVLIILSTAPVFSLAASVAVSIQWKYEGLPATMQLYAIDRAKKSYLWQTKNVKTFAEIPALKIINKPLDLNKGSGQNFVLVYHNNTDKPVYFFAAPHDMSPKKYTLGFKFKCLCINHAFEIKAKHYWYRVVRIKLSSFVKGNKLNVVHTLVKIDKERQQRFSLKKPR